MIAETSLYHIDGHLNHLWAAIESPGRIIGVFLAMKSQNACRGVLRFQLSQLAPLIWIALGAIISFYGFPKHRESMTACAIILSGAAIAGLPFCGPIAPGFMVSRGWCGTEDGKGPDAESYCRASIMQALLFLSIGIMEGVSGCILEKANDAPGELARFQLLSCSGTVLSDSQKTKNGNTLLVLRLESMEIKGIGFKAKVGWPRAYPDLKLVTDSSANMPAGQSLEVSRLSVIDTEKALYYAPGNAVLSGVEAPFLARCRWACKNAFRAQIAKVSGDSFPLAEALLIGIRDDLDAEINTLFRDAGCSHILSLSGQHLSILCMLVSLAAGKIIRNKSLLDWVSFGFAIAFTWMVGGSPPLLRSIFMMGFGLLFKAMDRPQSSPAILSACFCLSLALDPDSARSLSFLLSYAAMAGLMILSPRWRSVLQGLPDFLAQPLAASLAALCATALISLDAFGTVTMGGIVSSTLSGPLILLFMWSLLGSCVLIIFLPFLEGLLSAWHELVHSAIMLIMKIGAALPRLEAESAGEKTVAGVAIVAVSLFVYSFPYLEQMHFNAASKRQRSTGIQ
ncbi:MAG: ComEC/Rec2 family competence protein [Spirochaetaceae bacterium]|nr:ComEC/Rec2 family competence protein [Spirochaetaceae bacterium]